MNAMNTVKSKSLRLLIINKWLQEHVQNRTVARKRNIVELHTLFVEDVLADLTQALSIASPNEIIVTVRSSFRKESLYLRPVYSKPEEMQKFFVTPEEQEPFRFPDKKKAFRGVVFVDGDPRSSNEYTFSALHKIRPHSGDSNDNFPERINRVRSKLLRRDGLKESVNKANYCYFAGRNKSGIRSNSIELQHILAVYFSSTKCGLADDSGKRLIIQGIVRDLFDGLDLISHIDARNFEAEGLQLVAELLPEFSRDNIAPADKIAFAVERLGQLLTHHMIGRHGGSKESKPAKLFFISTTFERQNDKRKSLHPRLEIYPHVYRHDHWNVSFFVTHRDIPTATKFLLWRYLISKRHRIVETTSASKDIGAVEKLRPIILSPNFEKMFTSGKLETDPVESWQDIITLPRTPDFLNLSRDSYNRESFAPKRGASTGKRVKSPWTALNRAAEPGCRSIAAFVVEGREINTGGNIKTRCLPRGVFAIESHYEDGFSDSDVASLRIVFQGLASLVRLISHQHSPIDYRSLIARTFHQDAEPAMREDEKVLRLLFLVQKLDAELFHRILPQCRESPDSYGLDKSCLPALERIEKICRGESHPTPERRSEILRKRMREMQTLLSNPSEKLVRELLLMDCVLAFLEACPENFTWASYLACMAQTLGDRIDSGTTELPQFNRMIPGFSASGMFMAMVEGEFRQVVKLSTAEKLRNEARLYRKWVRYRLVNAARISTSTGLAFETTGEAGRNSAMIKPHRNDTVTILPLKNGQNAESDGVLVSDLVSGGKSGQDKVRSFLYVVAKRIGGLKDANIPTIKKICTEIANVFGPNAELWKTDRELARTKTLTAVLSAFRIPVTTHDGMTSIEIDRNFEEEIKRLEGMRKSGEPLKFESLIRKWGQDRDQNVSFLEREHSRICHGDLNARNLTWAEGLQSFFLIDFEHVGPAPNGVDQFRLLVNLVTELWSELNSNISPDDTEGKSEFNNLYAALTNGLGYLKNVFEILIRRGGELPLSKIADHTADKHPGGLTEILKTILMTVDSERKLMEPKWRLHWALMLLCASAKEFSYTCRTASAITFEEAKEILAGNALDTMSIPDTEIAVRSYKPKRTVPPSYKGDCMHHFIAGRLLLSFANALEGRDRE